MKIPSLFYGRIAAVKSRCRKLAKTIVATSDPGAFDPGPLLDTSDMPGLLLLDERQMILNPAQHDFHCYVLSQTILERAITTQDFRVLDPWLQSSLAEPWRFLGVQVQEMTRPLGDNPSMWRGFVDAAGKFWPELVAEGKRFGPYVNYPHDAWYVMRNLRFVLANLGVQTEVLKQDLPPGGPAELLRQADAQRNTP